MSKGGKGPSPNDQRSNALNPNNAAYQAAQSNHSDQMNSNNSAYSKSRSQKSEDDE